MGVVNSTKICTALIKTCNNKIKMFDLPMFLSRLLNGYLTYKKTSMNCSNIRH